MAAIYLGSDDGYIRMYPITSALQPVFKNVGLSRLYRANTKEEVIHTLISWNREIKVGDQAMEEWAYGNNSSAYDAEV